MKHGSKQKNSVVPPMVGILIPRLFLLAFVIWMAGITWHFSKMDLGIIEGFKSWVRLPWAIVPGPGSSASYLWRFAGLAAMNVAIISVGHRAIRATGVRSNNVFELLALSFGMGYGIWGTTILLMGVSGLWTRSAFLVTTASAAIFSLFEVRKILTEIRSYPSGMYRPSSWDKICIGIILSIMLYNLRFALIPETFYDALHYHLALPAKYLLRGRIFSTPENSYAGIPALPQMFNGLTLSLDSWGILAALTHFQCAIWIAIGLIGLAIRISRPSAGIIAALIFLTTPVVMGETFRTAVELEWAVLELCCIIAFLAALNENEESTERYRWLALSGIFMGLAMCTKYPAWLLPIAFLMNISLKSRATSSNGFLSVKEGVWLIVFAVPWVLPWVVKNLIFFKNPLYPFFHEVFNPTAAHMPDWRQINAAGSNFKNFLSSQGITRYLGFPLRLLNPPEGSAFSIGLTTLSFAPLLLLPSRVPLEKTLVRITLGLLIPLSLLSEQTRFFTPHLLPLFLLFGCIVTRIQPDWIRKLLLTGICAIAFTMVLMWNFTTASKDKMSVYLQGEDGYSAYLGHSQVSYAAPPYAAIEYVNRETPPNSRVLVYGDGRSFYLRRAHLASSPDQIPILEAWASESRSPEDLKKLIDDNNIDFIIINLGSIAVSKAKPRTSNKGLRVLAEFWRRYTVRVFGVQDNLDRWVGVYKVLDASEAVKPHPYDDIFGALEVVKAAQ